MFARINSAGSQHRSCLPPRASSASTYGEHETSLALEHLRARRSHAFTVGEAKARRREISADAYLFLYKELVGLAADRTYCWPGLDYLVNRLDTSVGTLKRWFKELEQANLIQRKPRPGGQTSLTYIMAYLQVDCGAEAQTTSSDLDQHEDSVQLADVLLEDEASVTSDQEMLGACRQSEAPATAPVFFVPAQEIRSDPGAGSDLIPQTVKSQETRDQPGDRGGASRETPVSNTDAVPNSEVMQLLRTEGVLDFQAVRLLQHKPIAELRAISGYLDRQTNVRCRPGLFVWLAQQDFGAKLLAGRHQAERRKGCRKPSTCAHPGYDAVTTMHEREPMPDELGGVWQQALDRVSQVVPEDAFEVWLKPATWLLLEERLAVVGTPNVFVRGQIDQQYRDHLESALSTVRQRPVVVETVIG